MSQRDEFYKSQNNKLITELSIIAVNMKKRKCKMQLRSHVVLRNVFLLVQISSYLTWWWSCKNETFNFVLRHSYIDGIAIDYLWVYKWGGMFSMKLRSVVGRSLNERKWSIDKCSEVEWSVVGRSLNERKWSIDKCSEVEWSVVGWSEV